MAVGQKQAAIDIHEVQADLFRRRYEELERDPYRSAFTYGRKKVDLLLDEYLPQRGDGKQLLDAGCGPGWTLHTYSGRGYQCTGLDAAAGMVENARTLNPDLDIRLGDVEALPYQDASFDYLLSIEVIRYLEQPEKCVSEFARVLRPGGVALVTAMPPLSLTGYPLLNIVSGRVQVGKFSKVKQYFHSVGRLQKLFKECGFSRVEVRAAFWGPWVNLERVLPGTLPSLLRRWEPMDDRLAKAGAFPNLSNHLLVAATR